MGRSCLVFAGLFGLTVSFSSVVARAQSTASDKASAEALFDAAVKAMKDGHFAEACPKLEASQRSDPGVGTLLYLGECYEKLGRTASAWATFREAASQAEASGQTKRAKLAKDRVARLDTQLSYLTIEVAEATRTLPGLKVRRDGADAGLGIIGAAVPQDPGPVKIEVTAPDHESFSVTVRIQPLARQTVLIPSLAASDKPAPAEVPVTTPPSSTSPAAQPANQPTTTPIQPSAPPADESNPGTGQRIIGIVIGGVGLAGIGVGSYFGISAMGNEKKADRQCAPALCQEQPGYDRSDAARKDAVISNIGFAAGGGLVVVGAVVYFLAPSKSSSVGVTPLVAPGFAGVSVGGRL